MANNRTSAIVSAVVGCLAAFLTCVAFFYFFERRPQPVGEQNIPQPTPTLESPSPGSEVAAAAVNSVTIKTVYRGYFEPGDRCSKSYDEYFGNDDGSFSSNSPCSLTMTFDRSGNARRSVELSRWSKGSGMRPVERLDSAATTTPDQFDKLVQAIVGNDAFRSWREGTMVTASNCSVTVVHSSGSKTPMSNVDENTTVFLEMIDAFKHLDKELRWETVR